jgi:hypothetical protein
MDGMVNGLAGLVMIIVSSLESALADGMALTGLPPRVETVLWAVIIVLCLTAVVRLMGGWIRTVMVLFIVGVSVHAGLTHGFNAFD